MSRREPSFLGAVARGVARVGFRRHSRNVPREWRLFHAMAAAVVLMDLERCWRTPLVSLLARPAKPLQGTQVACHGRCSGDSSEQGVGRVSGGDWRS